MPTDMEEKISDITKLFFAYFQKMIFDVIKSFKTKLKSSQESYFFVGLTEIESILKANQNKSILHTNFEFFNGHRNEIHEEYGNKIIEKTNLFAEASYVSCFDSGESLLS